MPITYEVEFQTEDLTAVFDSIRYDGAKVKEHMVRGANPDKHKLVLMAENPKFARWNSFGLHPRQH